MPNMAKSIFIQLRIVYERENVCETIGKSEIVRNQITIEKKIFLSILLCC